MSKALHKHIKSEIKDTHFHEIETLTKTFT